MVLKNINKAYGEKIIFNNFNCEFLDKKITVILGESGVGKTTLLNIISGLTSCGGEIDGSKNVSYLFHNDRLIPNLNVGENLKFINKDIDVERELKKVDLQDASKKYPSELSAGMSRRVSILRAISFPADILLLDEPFGNLDYYLKYKMMDLIKEHHKINNNTIIMVTHDIDEAVYMADKILILNDGKIKKEFDSIDENTRKQILKVFLKK